MDDLKENDIVITFTCPIEGGRQTDRNPSVIRVAGVITVAVRCKACRQIHHLDTIAKEQG